MKKAAKKRVTIKTSQICEMAILTSLAIVLACFARGIWPTAGFLEYTPADVPVLMGTFMYGPAAGVIMAALVAIIQGVSVSASSGIIGIVMNFISIGVFVFVAGMIYKFKHSLKGAVVSLIAGALCGVAAMILWNIALTPLFMKVDRSMVLAMIPTVFLPFNLVRYFSNAAITFILYKSTHKLLKFAFKNVPDIKLGKKLSGSYASDGEDETCELAGKVADTLKGGEIILLEGELGAGKTTFTKGLAKALGVTEEVTSPTFTIMNVFESGRLKLNHLDMYRVESSDELYELGIEDEIGGEDCVIVIEWNKLDRLTGRIITVKITGDGENTRKIEIEDSGEGKLSQKPPRKKEYRKKEIKGETVKAER